MTRRGDAAVRTGASLGVVAGVVLTVVAAAAGWGGADAPPPPERPVADPAAAEALVAAWERSLTSRWVVRARVERRRGDEVLVDAERTTVQAPPDRLVREAGTVEGRLDGREVGCAPDPDDVPRCRAGAAVPPHPRAVAEQVDALRSAVDDPDGDGALYAVRARGDCFSLVQQRAYRRPPFGERARFCFDAATGAPVLQETWRGDTVDRARAVEVREVRPADLEL